MSKAKFTKTQLKDLIDVYQAEVKKLNFQIQNARKTIAELKAELKTAPDDAKPTAKKEPAKKTTKKGTKKTPKKTPAKATTTKKTVAKKKTKKTSKKGSAGRKPIVTPWDNFVLTAINEAGKGLVSGELFTAVKAKAKEAKEYKNDATTKTLINRALQKLVNKQKVLAKFKHAGRGFAYGLPSWGSRGRLKPPFKV